MRETRTEAGGWEETSCVRRVVSQGGRKEGRRRAWLARM